MSTITKGQVAKSDFKLWDGKNATFTRSTTTGGSETLNAIDWAGVDILQVYGNGVTKTEGTISAALAAIGTTNVTRVFLAPGTWTISTDSDYSAYTNIIWDIQPGAVFSITAAKTLTLYTDNNIIANSGQTIASGAGTIAFTVPILRFKVDNAEQVTIQDGKIEPTTDNDVDLGTTGKGFKDIHFEGTSYQLGVALSKTGTFANNANDNPNISDTVFTVTGLTVSTWESVGPTDSGADHIWTALDSVPSGVDWVEIRVTGSGSSTSVSGIKQIYVYVRGGDGEESNETNNRIFSLGAYGNADNISDDSTSTAKTQVDSGNIFDMHYATGFEVTTLTAFLIGYGYNQV